MVVESIENEKSPVIGVVFEYITKDSNNDGKLTQSDKKTVGFYQLKQKTFTTIEENIERKIDLSQISDKELLLFYAKGDKSFYKKFHIKKKSGSDSKELIYPK